MFQKQLRSRIPPLLLNFRWILSLQDNLEILGIVRIQPYTLAQYADICCHHWILKQFSMEKKEDEKANKITFRSVPEFRGLFIDQCLAQATEHGFSGTSLKQTSWGNLCKFFSEKYDCTTTQKKLRNHWDYLRTQYVTWSRLFARTGHGYNAETNTFDWNEEQWSELDKTIKNASQFKNKGLEDAEKLQNLFDGKFSTGVNRDTPGRMEPPCSAGTSTTNGSDSRTSLGK
ncbi:hypothetical protein C5167_026169 [Papaver somniferum]|nr:hypothetical protein C5167_026169 [Papaver somniferum]